MSAPRYAALLSIGLLLVGCSLTATDESTPSLETTLPTATTVPATTGPEVETTTTTVSGPSTDCLAQPDTEMDPAALGASQISGDLDGDGHNDVVTGYLLGSSDVASATAAVLHVELASGWGTALVVNSIVPAEAGPPMAFPRVIVEIGDAQMLAAGIQGILPGILESFFVIRDCELILVGPEDGSIPEIWSGGGAGHDDWATCLDDGVAMGQFWKEDPTAESARYVSGTVIKHTYRDGFFAAAQEALVDVTFPATYEQVTAAYPNCLVPKP